MPRVEQSADVTAAYLVEHWAASWAEHLVVCWAVQRAESSVARWAALLVAKMVDPKVVRLVEQTVAN